MKHISHSAILHKYAGRISVTFLVLIFENILFLLEPFVLGVAINGLTENSWQGVYIFLLVEVAIVVVGVIRRFYDTRAYGHIYREISEDISAEAIRDEEDLSPAIGRADLLQEVTDFFEKELPMAFGSVFSIVGAMVMLFLLSPGVGVAGIIAGGVIGLVFALSRRRIKWLNARINDELEARARIFMARRREGLDRHFSGIVRHSISLSDLEARNYGLSYLLVIFLITYTLYETVAVQQAPIGNVFAILTYAQQFAQGVLILPMMYQQYIRTAEITGRIRGGSGTEPEKPVE